MANEQPKVPTSPAPVTPAEAAPVVPHIKGLSLGDSIVVYQHSNLFYWWPVWFFGFVFAAITYFGDHHMAIVPAGTKAVKDVEIKDEKGDFVKHDVLVLDKGKKHLTHKDRTDNEIVNQPTIFVSRYRTLGTMYLFILLIVIFITNITLRGQWSLVVLITLSMVAIIFWLAGYWEIIFERLGNMSIYINLGGYMMISLVIFLLWIVNFFFFDRQIYVVFTPGQVRLCLEIGSGETIYDSFGMTVQKERTDIFRHTILGFGSGDIMLRFSKIEHPIELHNVLNVTSVLKKVEQMTKEKIVVTEKGPVGAAPNLPTKP
jgi:hypothetical protein